MYFYIKNFGCRLNHHEGDIIAEKLIANGYRSANFRDADIVIVNGCTVTGRADQKVRQFIHRTRREKPNAKILLTGCTASAIMQKLLPELDGIQIIPPRMRYDISEIIAANFQMEISIGGSADDFITIDGTGISRTRAQLKIQDGCNRRCSYCIVPLVRGKSRCRKSDDIIEQTKIFVDRGFKEIVLTGVDIGDWNEDSKTLADLLKSLISQTSIYRIRLSSIEPPGLSDELLELVATEHRIASHLHIPIQSGSQRLLKDMNRPKYRLDELLEKLTALRRKRTDICFGTDIIVGYPTETDYDFEDTVKLLKSGIFAYTHIFRFSPRPKTPASKLKQLPSKLLAERVEILHKIDRENRINFARKFVRKKLDFIVEKQSNNIVSGHTGNYLKVRAEGFAERGEIALVEIDSSGEMLVGGIYRKLP